jgi:hypothetical protein
LLFKTPTGPSVSTSLDSSNSAVLARMALDSAAIFSERGVSLGLEAHLERFKKAKWTTFAKLAFSTKFTPGGDEAAFEKDVLIKGLGDVEHDDKAEMRRLFYEAYTLAADQLKRMLVNGSDEMPRAVPAPEKVARRKRAAQALQGLELKGELDISDRLLERAIEIYDSSSLGYIGLDVCTKKSNELLNIHKDKRWEQVPNAVGIIELRLKADESRTAIDTQFAFSFAMQRRSLALYMGDVMAFELSEKLRSKYIAVLMKAPQEGYAQVQMQQILAADAIFWIEMQECDELENGVKRNAAGRPCDQAFPSVFNGTEFRMAIAQRQVPLGRQQNPNPPQAPKPYAPSAPIIGGAKTKAQLRKERANDNKRKDQQPQPAGRPQQPGPKAPRTERTGNLPKALIGCCNVSSAATGSKRFCFAFNLGTCKGATPGASCTRGFHGCMKPAQNGEACSGNHAASACTNR